MVAESLFAGDAHMLWDIFGLLGACAQDDVSLLSLSVDSAHLCSDARGRRLAVAGTAFRELYRGHGLHPLRGLYHPESKA
jgi:hypothetical protein